MIGGSDECHEYVCYAIRSDISTLQLARLLEQEKADADEVAGYYKEFAESQSSNEPSRDAAEAILYLVEYHLYRNRLEEAENLATRLLGWPFPVRHFIG